ncbi:MAG: hypothetical protein M1334_03690 [Patescibacteria group bacterium]|nr:hypothetical protein [Patescibacteria group bacterium]
MIGNILMYVFLGSGLVSAMTVDSKKRLFHTAYRVSIKIAALAFAAGLFIWFK